MSDQEMSNMEIAVFVLHQIGGAQRHIHTEDVALECYRLFPSKFSWEKYPEHPDAEPARHGLFDASRAKYGRLTRGNKKIGWMLTPAGVDRARELMPLISNLKGTDVRIRATRQEEDRFLNALEKHPALQQFAKTGDFEGIRPHQIASFLQCSLDSGVEVMRRRAEQIQSRAYDKGRQVIIDFMAGCRQQYPELFGEADG